MALLCLTAQPTFAANFPDSFVLTIHYDTADITPARMQNAVLAFKELYGFLANTRFSQGHDYSFKRDVLPSQYDDAGSSDAANDPASALNLLFHRALFWDGNGTQQPVVEVTRAIPIKNDRTFGAFAVTTATQDFTWQLNPAYMGMTPRIECQFDAASATLTLTMTFSDAITPPNPPSLKDKLAMLNSDLKSMIGSRRLGVSVIPVSDPTLALNVNADAQVPIASAWKGPGVVYFFENVSPSVWNGVPVQYWHTANIADVPAQYRDTLLKNRDILWDVYTMAVFSGNHEAGDVLGYVFRQLPREKTVGSNPIIAFNDWSQQAVGISSESGMYNWDYGDLENNAIFDPRFAHRQLMISGNGLFYANMFSAHDLALFYLRLATTGKAQSYYQTAVDLLSIRNPIVSKIEGQTPGIDVQTATKDGYFDPGSPLSRGHSVDNDAGLLIYPDGRVYVVAFTAFDAVDSEGAVIERVLQTISQMGLTYSTL